MALTSRERLLRLFHGQEIDRVPIWLLAPYHRLLCYADIYHIDAYQPVTKAIELCGDTFDRRRPDMGFCYNANPEIVWSSIAREGTAGTRVDYGGSSFEKYTARANGRTSVKYFVEDPDELLDVLSIPYVPHRPDAARLRAEKEALGERGLLMMDLGDPLEPLYHLCSAENFSMWTLTDLDAMLAFTDQMHERVLALYKNYLELDIADAYFIVGAEFAGPPLVSPALFNELSCRYLKELIALIRSYGKIAIVHYHGNLYHVLKGFREIDPDGLHTVEAPPIGDCTITQAREALGRNVTLIGNIQYDDLESREPEEIRCMVRAAMEEGKNSGRFILSPTAGPYDSKPSERLIANYLEFIRAGIEFGGYDR